MANVRDCASPGDERMDPSRTHKHKCPKCGNIWEHSDNCVNNTEAHTCSECGTEQWGIFGSIWCLLLF